MKQPHLVCYLNFNKHIFFVFFRTKDFFEGGEFLETTSYTRGEHKKIDITGKGEEEVNNRHKATV